MDTPDEPESPSGNSPYYKARSYAWIIALLLTPIISITGSIVSSRYTSEQAARQANVELVKLAVGILESPESSLVLTEWALGALSLYTDVDISEQRKREISQEIRSSTGVSIRDIEDHNPLGGENSEVREIGRALIEEFGIKF